MTSIPSITEPEVTMIWVLVLGSAACLAITIQHLRAAWHARWDRRSVVTTWRKVWPATPSTWAQLDRRIWRRMTASVSAGVAGHVILPTRFVAWVASADYEMLGAGRTMIEDHLAGELQKRAAKQGWHASEAPSLEIREDPDLLPGQLKVDGRFTACVGNVSASFDGESTAPAPRLHSALAQTELLATQAENEQGIARTVRVSASSGRTQHRLTGPDGLDVDLHPSHGAVTVGRERTATVVLHDSVVSGWHARLTFRDSGWWITDTHSKNGTWIGDTPVQPGDSGVTRLTSGDHIRLGTSGPVLVISEL
jgi:hypothetical protein